MLLRVTVMSRMWMTTKNRNLVPVRNWNWLLVLITLIWNVLDPYMRTTRDAVNWFTYGLPPPANVRPP
jgi:hypothetical protein